MILKWAHHWNHTLLYQFRSSRPVITSTTSVSCFDHCGEAISWSDWQAATVKAKTAQFGRFIIIFQISTWIIYICHIFTRNTHVQTSAKSTVNKIAMLNVTALKISWVFPLLQLFNKFGDNQPGRSWHRPAKKQWHNPKVKHILLGQVIILARLDLWKCIHQRQSEINANTW